MDELYEIKSGIRRKIDEFQKQIKNLEQALKALEAESKPTTANEDTKIHGRFSKLSLRDAIQKIVSEGGHNLSTSEVEIKLREGAFDFSQYPYPKKSIARTLFWTDWRKNKK